MLRTIFFVLITCAATACAEFRFPTTSETHNATLAIFRAQEKFPELKREFQEFCFELSQGKWTQHSQASSAICLLDAFDRYRSTVYRPGTTILDEQLARQRWFCKDPEFDSTRERLAKCVSQLSIPDHNVDRTDLIIINGKFDVCQIGMTSLCMSPSIAQMLTMQMQVQRDAQQAVDDLKAEMAAQLTQMKNDTAEKIQAMITESTKRVQDHNDQTIETNHRIRMADGDALSRERVLVAVFDFLFVKAVSRSAWGEITQRSCNTNPGVMAITGVTIVVAWSVFQKAESLIWSVLGWAIQLSPERQVPMSLENVIMHIITAFLLRSACIFLEVGPVRIDRRTVTNITNVTVVKGRSSKAAAAAVTATPGGGSDDGGSSGRDYTPAWANNNSRGTLTSMDRIRAYTNGRSSR